MKHFKIIGTCLVIFGFFFFVETGGFQPLVVMNLGFRDFFDFWIYIIPMIILTPLLVVSKEEVFSLWWKFCVVFFSISAVYIWLTDFPETGGGLGWNFSGWGGASLSARLVVVPAFFLLSIAIITIKSYKLRGK